MLIKGEQVLIGQTSNKQNQLVAGNNISMVVNPDNTVTINSGDGYIPPNNIIYRKTESYLIDFDSTYRFDDIIDIYNGDFDYLEVSVNVGQGSSSNTSCVIYMKDIFYICNYEGETGSSIHFKLNVGINNIPFIIYSYDGTPLVSIETRIDPDTNKVFILVTNLSSTTVYVGLTYIKRVAIQ